MSDSQAPKPVQVEIPSEPQKSRKERIAEQDIAYMSSLSQAALEKPTKKSQLIVWIVLLVVIWLIFWASQAELDKIVRGDGKVVPSSEIKTIQNLEGGIVSEIFVSSGDKVKKDQVLLKLDNTQFASSFGESELREEELNALALRLEAEAFAKPYDINQFVNEDPQVQDLYRREFQLYQARQKQLKTADNILVQQIEQKKLELKDAISQKTQLSRSLELLRKEVNFTKPLVRPLLSD